MKSGRMSKEQVREAVDRFLARIRQQMDAQMEVLAADLMQIARGDIKGGGDASDVAQAVAKGGSQARHALIARVIETIRRLDDATTLRGVLDALHDGACAEAARVAVFVVANETLRGYRNHGFAPGMGPVDLMVSASPLLASAVNLRQATVVPQVIDRVDPMIPTFMRVAPGHTGRIVPVTLEKHVVALLYADGPDRQADEPGAPVWTELVEVLVRHASARLENVTSQRAVEVLPSPS
jgi:hypothetical protein